MTRVGALSMLPLAGLAAHHIEQLRVQRLFGAPSACESISPDQELLEGQYEEILRFDLWV